MLKSLALKLNARKSANQSTNEKINKIFKKINKDSKYDLIGPPHKISNLRQFRYYIPKDESKLEYDYRMLRERVFEFNNDYWTQQNLKFLESKKIFIQQNKMRQNYLDQLNKNNLARKSSSSTSQILESDLLMNDFYKQFLNENYQNHYEYNKKWLKLNFQLLWMATRVNLYRFNKKLRFFSK